jgi:membrane-bound inhibitor of C-type lysozyme
MNHTTRITILTLAVIAAILVFFVVERARAPGVNAGKKLITTVAYACNEGKTISANYYQGEDKPAASPNMPPTPSGSVDLALSDGRMLSLQQTISADGTRYANNDESFVFWSKGNGALVLQNNVEKSYIGCVALAPDPGGLTGVYHNGTEGITMRVPKDFALDTSYVYQDLGPGKSIHGVKFTIPESMATGTNLGSDSYISIEQIPLASACSADMFLDQGVKASTTTDAGMEYSFASTTGAGAGNRYEQIVYALPGTNPCVAVRYFIHYGVFENYPAGTIKEFDEAKLTELFDSIRRTLTLAK